MKKNNVTIYVDGACSGNPGVGGWGVYKIDGDLRETMLSGREENTTNNRMELFAAIKAISSLSDSDDATIYTDSQYLKNGITLWINNWIKNGWKTSNRNPVKNYDLWQELLKVQKGLNVKWSWVKGHSGVKGNEIADRLAVKAKKCNN